MNYWLKSLRWSSKLLHDIKQTFFSMKPTQGKILMYKTLVDVQIKDQGY
jgi:hypothetical protein